MKLSRLVKSVPALQQAVRHYDGLVARDKKVLNLLVVVLFFASLYFLVWLPSHQFMKSAQADLENSTATLVAIKQSLPQARLAAKLEQNTKGPVDPQTMVTTISSAGKKYNVELKRFEPSGDSNLRVWLEDVAFNSLVQWMQELDTKHSLKVSEISVDRDENSGFVNVRLLIGP